MTTQMIATLATRTTHALCDAHTHGRISDTLADALSRDLATLASLLDKGEINAHEYKSDLDAIAKRLGA